MTEEHHKETLANIGTKFPATDDKRTANNVMRHEYRVLTDGEKAVMKQIKDMGLTFIVLMDEIGGSREISLAKTKMEEAVMWAVKHITR